MAGPAGETHRRAAWLLSAAALVFLGCDQSATSHTRDVPIRSDFGTKIVYGTSRRLDASALREHCAGLNGTFNTCGTTCAPGTAVCAEVCAYTCEDLKR